LSRAVASRSHNERCPAQVEENAAARPQAATADREAGIWQGGKGAAEALHRQDDLLHRLAAKYKPTKRQHNCIPRYSLHFAAMRERVRRVVEIDVQKPASLTPRLTG